MIPTTPPTNKCFDRLGRLTADGTALFSAPRTSPMNPVITTQTGTIIKVIRNSSVENRKLLLEKTMPATFSAFSTNATKTDHRSPPIIPWIPYISRLRGSTSELASCDSDIGSTLLALVCMISPVELCHPLSRKWHNFRYVFHVNKNSIS